MPIQRVKCKKVLRDYYLKEDCFIKKKMEVILSGAAARTGILRKNEKTEYYKK